MTILQRLAGHVAQFVGRDSWIIRRLRPAYEMALEWVHLGRGLPWHINGVPCRIDPRQRNRMVSHYESDVASYLAANVRPGAVCLDVGANVGVYVLQFAHWVGPTGRVIAFEPNPAARSALDRHVKLNGLENVVSTVPAAVGESAGRATLYAASADGMSRLDAPNEALEQTVPVEVDVLTLDEYCRSADLQPDCLLVDIEGFEVAALRGGRDTISRGRGHMQIVVEMHPEHWTSAGTTLDDATALLRDLGLRAIPLTGQQDPMTEHGIVRMEWT